MPQPTRDLIPGALDRVISDLGISYEDVASRCRMVRRESRATRAMIWRAATGRRGAVSPQTANDLVWGLDVRPSTLFVMPWVPLE